MFQEYLLQPALKRNQVSTDILLVSQLLEQVFDLDYSVQQQLQTISVQSPSTIARFQAHAGLVHLNVHSAHYDLVYESFRQMIILSQQHKFLRFQMQKQVDVSFAAALNCQQAELFCFQFCADLFSEQMKQVYDKLCENVSEQKEVEVKYAKTAVKVQSGQLLYHSRIHQLQLFLLSIPLHERGQISYGDLQKVLQTKTDAELEQVFTSLILQGIVKARMDSIEREVNVSYVKPVSGNEQIKQVLIERLEEWVGRIKDCKAIFEETLHAE
ncbi:PCI_domain-containing protein [Hexamita inflata]|uniref:PCI domain-containing protein n=1 Tax=Hexamita inflata TaxID=28002 RepID=A0AA86PNY5_9EUKA|nr:PCI domain-containing protein [Hexamita inflata]